MEELSRELVAAVSMSPHSRPQAAAQLPNYLLDTTGFSCFHLPGCQVASLSLPTQLPVLLASLRVIPPTSARAVIGKDRSVAREGTSLWE